VSGQEPRAVRRRSRPAGAHAFRALATAAMCFVSNRVANTISKIDSRRLKVVADAAPAGPTAWTCRPGASCCWSASRWAAQAHGDRYRAKKVVHQVNVGKSPHGVWTLDHAAALSARRIMQRRNAIVTLLARSGHSARGQNSSAQPGLRQAAVPDVRHRPHGSGRAGGRGAAPPAGARDLLCRQRAHPGGRRQPGRPLGAVVEGARGRRPRIRLAHLGPRLLARRPARGEPRFRVRASAGDQAGRDFTWSAAQYCEQIDAGQRAPAGADRQEAAAAVSRAGRQDLARAAGGGPACGYAHVGWAPAGFLGDELPSDKYPNRRLLDKALRDIRPGDILLAHLGIWSRQDPWAPAVLEPLIEGLKARGFCFAPCASTRPTRAGSRSSARARPARWTGWKPFASAQQWLFEALIVQPLACSAGPGQPAGRRLSSPPAGCWWGCSRSPCCWLVIGPLQRWRRWSR
jgi:hypothetical protein